MTRPPASEPETLPCATVRPRTGPWTRGAVIAATALLLGLLLLLHGSVPNRVGNVGSLVETFLPWFGLAVPVLLVAALWRRSASAVVALLVPVAVWLTMFGGLLGDRSQPGGGLTVAGHNVGADNPDPVGTARALVASGPDVLALQELTPQARGTYERELATAFPYRAVLGTVGVWSRFPLSDVRPVDVAMDTTRALRAAVTTDRGPLAVYVAHLGSVRVFPRNGFWTDSRDDGARALGAALAAERADRVVLLGDLNGSMDDRAFDGVTGQMRSAHDAAGDGFGFTWPAAFPVVRSDEILVRGVQPESSRALPATGSDHRPVAARVTW